MSGTLYVVGTPIGNLEDLSPRAADVLRGVGIIACEDTRVTAKLLSRYGIRARTVSYHEHNETQRAAELVQKLLKGQDVALVSDAGTPCVSDPGYRVVREARRKGLAVRTVPGPSAALAALAISGLPTSSFCFLGFLPTRKVARTKAIEEIARSRHTFVIFESARRTPTLLNQLAERLGDRSAFAAREMTKIHEEHRAGSLTELAEWARAASIRGELTLVVGPPEKQPLVLPERREIHERFSRLTKQGMTRREAVKGLARELGQPSRQIYREVLDFETENRSKK
jgi:16S rRNA (cytidine1402-2'-O)-methyltransferase